MQIYCARSPAPQQYEDGQLVRPMPLGAVLLTAFDVFSPLQQRGHPAWSAMAICLDNQIFYEPASRGPRVREGGRSAAIFGVPLHPPLPQDTHDPQGGSVGGSQADAILILSDDEFNDFHGQPDTSFEWLDGLLPDARNKGESGRVTSTGKGVDAASDDNNTPEPLVTSIAGLGNESHASPMELASLASHHALPCGPESSCRRGDGCDRHPHLSVFYRRRRNAESSQATVDDEGIEGDEPEPADAGLPLQLQPPDNQLEVDHHPTNGMRPATPPQVVESRAHTPTLPDDESTSELEPADAEPRLQPQSPSGAASGRGVDPQQRSGSCGLSQHRDHRDHRDDNDQANDPEQHHLSLRTIEEIKTMKRAHPRCRTTKGITTVSWSMPAHPCSRPCSHPPAEIRPARSPLPATVT
ncbi:hypothetical protein N656DRAFT_642230 [Canariomyces notabilis]|uniref:Uncharacterized protein n=1 Tax=Canariomyces notabilis TaxID=2074819 RepID=A0AAN6TES6_9PEZI|nr:hypothetical protein N656DRAFT_642230 [Canariomyces arenarius]